MSRRVEIIQGGVRKVFGPFEDPLSGFDEESIEQLWREHSEALAAPVLDAWREAYRGVPDGEVPEEDVNLFMDAWDSKPGGS